MTSFALVLGGGGMVGVAWEVGVLAGLADAGIDITEADLIVGSSAGSLVGTQLRQGRTLASMVENQRNPTNDGISGPPLNTDLSGLIEIMGAIRGAKERTPELFQKVGRLAMDADTPPESEWIGRFELLVGDDDWPDGDLRLNAVDCNTGTRRSWSKADGVPLAAAVASSCAIPGVFPPISLDGSRFTDGGLWSSSNLDVVLDTDVECAIFVGPLRAGDPSATKALEREIAQLESAGRRAAAIVPGEAFATEIGAMNLMNPEFRERGVDLGFEDASASMDVVQALFG